MAVATGFARGATHYEIVEQAGVKSIDPKAALAALKSADLRFGLEKSISAEMHDLVAMELFGVDARVILGLSSKDAEAEFKRGEMNMNTDNTSSNLKGCGENPSVMPIWAYGVIAEDGSLIRHLDLPEGRNFQSFAKQLLVMLQALSVMNICKI